MNYPKRIYFKIVTPIRTLYRFFVRPKSFGVKCLIENSGKYLFVKINYGPKFWTVPGGVLNKNEDPEVGAAREAFEEVGIKVKNLINLGVYTSTRHYKRDTVYCYKAEVENSDVKIDPNEIQEYGWFSFDKVPEPKSLGVDDIHKLLNQFKIEE